MRSSSRSYQFQSQPQAVSAGGRAKYRDPGSGGGRRNLMHDRRVVRGNTHAAIIEQSSHAYQQRTAPPTRGVPRRRRRGRRIIEERDLPEEEQSYELDEPEGGWLEELPVPEEAKKVKDNRPPPKEIPFIPKPSGIDTATEVLSADLFDYDLAVEPVLETLVGKCLNQSLAEVLVLKEQIHLQQQERNFALRRQAKIAQTKRMEAEHLRRNEEKHRRQKQDEQTMTRERVTAHKLAARTSTSLFVQDLQAAVVAGLEEKGHYYNPVIKQVESVFLPWLLDQVQVQLDSVSASRKEVDTLLRGALDTVVAEARQAAEQRAIEAVEVARQEYRDQERRRIYREAQELALAEAEAARKAEADAAGGDEGDD